MAGQMVGPTDSYQFLSPCLLSRSPASRMCDSEEGRDGQRCDSEEGRAWRWGGGEEGTDSAVAREGCRHRSGTSAAAEEAMRAKGERQGGRRGGTSTRWRGRDAVTARVLLQPPPGFFSCLPAVAIDSRARAHLTRARICCRQFLPPRHRHCRLVAHSSAFAITREKLGDSCGRKRKKRRGPRKKGRGAKKKQRLTCGTSVS